MADRIGVISRGEIIIVEDTAVLMEKLGKKELTVHLHNPLERIPPELAGRPLALSPDGTELVYTFDSQASRTGIAGLLRQLGELGIDFKDLHTTESSLEEIFVSLVRARP
jgi:ABC-2 type transport system ATP-binding protein